MFLALPLTLAALRASQHYARSPSSLAMLVKSPFQGYLFISVLISQNSDLINLINNSIKNDLVSRNPVHVSLALQCIANVGSKDMAEAFAQDIPKLLVSG